ncbi:hypothetical protein AB0903_33095 [Streptomyces sp. NPDC048389]|uniref:hypothetical protein n=1 Tax=Streptomyces sp. NPDC048389 TaxID=3154622 RepID=UPI003452741D
MSFEEEWACLKADALARRSAATRLNQVADPGGGPQTMPGGGLERQHRLHQRQCELLVEIAGFLHEGRPDGDISTMAREPRAHSEVAAQVNRFSSFANDQFLDAVALFAALSTKLRAAGGDFVQVDDDKAARFLEVILKGDYIAPEAR